MKTRLTTLAVLITALGGFIVSPSSATASEQTQARMHRVDRVQTRRGEIIKPGTSRYLVREVIGSGHERLTPDLWLYHNYCPARNEVVTDACNLVIGFTNDRVSSLHLVNPRARKVFLARVDAGIVDSGGVLAAVAAPPPTGTAVATR